MIKINASKVKFTSEVKNGGKMNRLTIIDESSNKIVFETENFEEFVKFLAENDYEGNEEDLYTLINNDEKED